MRTGIVLAAAAATLPLCLSTPVFSADTDTAIVAIRKEIESLRKAYASRISALESQVKNLEAAKGNAAKAAKKASGAAINPSGSGGRAVRNNSFNPSISVILNGRVSTFSAKDSEIAGFAVGEEGERGAEGLSLDETELNFSANVDDKFFGSATAAIVREGGSDKIELEEAFIQTLPGIGLPDGARIKAGRAFWTLGYLNEFHTHADDFEDRPLPYRVFLNKSFNDDGVEAAWVLPTDFFAEIGGGVFRGDDFPFGGSSDGLGAWSAYARIGDDLRDNQAWRLGAYVLKGDSKGRMSNEDLLSFTGDSNLYVADLRYTWAPTGNPRDSEVIFQGEYFHRKEDGVYEDSGAGTGPVAFSDGTNGWYVQSIYKFHPQWRIGARYSRLSAPDISTGLMGSALDSSGHDPYAVSAMVDWTNSEFGRVRFQYNFEELAKGATDHQFLLQYVMSIGAHGAHPF